MQGSLETTKNTEISTMMKLIDAVIKKHVSASLDSRVIVLRA